MPDAPFRTIFRLSLIPGLCAPLTFALMVRETQRRAGEKKDLRASLEGLPPVYRRFLVAVGLFGSGDYSPTLLTMAAATLLRPAYGAVRAAEIAALLYVVRNIVYAASAFPIGALADRMAKIPLLAGGYLCAAIAAGATALLFTRGAASPTALAAVFVIAGVFAAAQDTIEGALPADLAGRAGRGTVYGTLGAVNGAGDLIASGLVGTLWTAVSPTAAFGTAAIIMTLGAAMTAGVRVR
jgi:MFS family permease